MKLPFQIRHNRGTGQITVEILHLVRICFKVEQLPVIAFAVVLDQLVPIRSNPPVREDPVWRKIAKRFGHCPFALVLQRPGILLLTGVDRGTPVLR